MPHPAQEKPEENRKWISTDIHKLKIFNSVTYQALHVQLKKILIEPKSIKRKDNEISEGSEELDTIDRPKLIKKSDVKNLKVTWLA